MGTDKRIDAATDDLSGKAKEAAGKLTNDEQLKHEGRMDQAKGSVKDAVEDVKDAARKATESIRETFKD